MDGASQHVKGLTIVVLGVLILTPDTLLIRLAATDHWTVLVWRGLGQALGLTLILLLVNGRDTPKVFRAVGRRGFLCAIMIAASTFLFVIALSHTTAANLLIIMAATPFFAAITSRIFLGEGIAMRTWMAIAVTLGGIGLLALESLGRGSILGDLIALGAAITLGANFTVLRHARAVNMSPAMVMSGLLVAAISWQLAPTMTLSGQQTACLLAMAVIVPVSVSLIILGPRFLPAAEVSLLMQIEAVLGPLWVWLAIGEAPGRLALLGGAVVVGTLVVHSMLTLKTQARRGP